MYIYILLNTCVEKSDIYIYIYKNKILYTCIYIFLNTCVEKSDIYICHTNKYL